VAIGAGSVAAWKEVDEALDTVTKKTGATGEALAEMQKQVREIATDIPVSLKTQEPQ
jgi:phage-related minor tail protein